MYGHGGMLAIRVAVFLSITATTIRPSTGPGLTRPRLFLRLVGVLRAAGEGRSGMSAILGLLPLLPLTTGSLGHWVVNLSALHV